MSRLCQNGLSASSHVSGLSPEPVSYLRRQSLGQGPGWSINGSEPVTGSVSLAHEFKHIIDHRFATLIFQQFPELSGPRWSSRSATTSPAAC